MAAYVIYNLTELVDEKAMGEYVQEFEAMFGKYDGKPPPVARAISLGRYQRDFVSAKS